jgi:CDP-6-deoxy-D-xylo-4-hexulose-3-dehydrase
VAGNFAKNEVVKYFDSTVHGTLKNAEHIDQNGLFVGNHHYPIPEAFSTLAKI